MVDLTSGHMVSSKPMIYPGIRRPEACRRRRLRDQRQQHGFFRSRLLRQNPGLTIDPSNTYASFIAALGGRLLGDEITSVAVDSTGVYLAGWSQATAYPSTCGAGASVLCAGTMAMILKMNLNLTAAPTAAYFGGETGSSVAVANGVAVLNQLPVIVGEEDAGATWPVKAPLELSPSSITPHAFAMKLTTALAQTWSTVLSGSGTETATAVALDAAGNVHITGGTTSGTSTGTPGPSTFLCNLIGGGAALNPPGGCTSTLPFKPYQSNQASSLIEDNAFYVEIASAGTAPAMYGTLFGGFANDIGNGIAVDTATPINAYIVGTSNSFGAGTVVGFTGLPGGAGCVNPVVTIPTPPVPPSALAAPGFFGVAQAAQGAAVVNDGEITSITITNPGAGYPVTGTSQVTVPVTITGCIGTPSVSAIILNVTGSSSANNLPIPGSTIALTNPGTGYAILAPPAVTFSGGELHGRADRRGDCLHRAPIRSQLARFGRPRHRLHIGAYRFDRRAADCGRHRRGPNGYGNLYPRNPGHHAVLGRPYPCQSPRVRRQIHSAGYAHSHHRLHCYRRLQPRLAELRGRHRRNRGPRSGGWSCNLFGRCRRRAHRHPG